MKRPTPSPAAPVPSAAGSDERASPTPPRAALATETSSKPAGRPRGASMDWYNCGQIHFWCAAGVASVS
eukprot:3341428-Lingulodinium_polyedra.AAC.1